MHNLNDNKLYIIQQIQLFKFFLFGYSVQKFFFYRV